MSNLDKIAEDLFSKIRGRFKSLTIGNDKGEVVTEPNTARFFDFTFVGDGKPLGQVSVALSEDDGVTVTFSNDFVSNEDQGVQNEWYGFLRELRQFAKKRMLNFDIRDINKSNLNKRDYNFLANTEDTQMTESKLYGTSRTSYQDVDGARIVIKHNANVNPENPVSRTQGINSIYIESAEGERFKYPYRHLNGARAMARHVAEGGNAYDDFGKHIVGLSEELSSLRKFKNYMSRSNVMAEGLSGYVDAVIERIGTVKKTVESLQRKSFYQEAVEGFEPTINEDIPDEVRENWIDQLTIRQFNEELADVFPYIYKLVSETTLAEEIGPEDLLGERDDLANQVARELFDQGVRYNSVEDEDKIHDMMIDMGYGKYMNDRDFEGEVFDDLAGMSGEDDDGQPSSYDEYQDLYGGDEDFGGYDEAIESSIEELMGQFGEGDKKDVLFQIEDEDGDKYEVVKYMGKVVAFDANPEELPGGGMGPYEYDPKTGTIETEHGPKKTRKVGDQTFDEADFDTAFKKRIQFSISGSDAVKKYMRKKADQLRQQNKDLDPGASGKGLGIGVLDTRKAYDKAKKKGAKFPSRGVSASPNTNKPTRLPDSIEESLVPQSPEVLKVISRDLKDLKSQKASLKKDGYDEDVAMIQYLIDDIMDIVDLVKKGGYLDGLDTAVQDIAIEYFDKAGVELEDEGTDAKEQQLPLEEKILSYFDVKEAKFPKGETAVLTMIEKEYGEEYIEPAKQFIEMINNKVAEMYGYKDTELDQNTQDLDRIRGLAGL